MRWRDVGAQPCSMARTLSVIGDTWTLLLLREAFAGTRTFGHFHERVGATRPIVANRLGKLVDHGILDRQPYQSRPPRYEYRLTARGLDLYPILLGLVAWGDRWMDPAEEGPPWEFVHRGCGQVMTARVVCSACGEPLEPGEVDPQPGPGLQRYLERLAAE